MKKYLFIVLLVGVCFGQKFQNAYDLKDIVEQDATFYKKFSDEKVNGKVFRMFETKKIFLGQMVDGKKDGEWVEWYDSGLKKSKFKFSKGIRDGKQIGWYENGKKRAEVNIKMGKVGNNTFWWQNGNLQSEVKTVDKITTFKTWNEDGSLTSQTQRYSVNDSINYKHGNWIGYHDDMTVSKKGSFQKGIGVIDYFSNKGIKIKTENFYKPDSFTSTELYKNGKIKSVQDFKGFDNYDAIPIGVSFFYDEDGIIIEERKYRDGILINKNLIEIEDFIENYPNGNKKIRGQTRAGKRHGTWYFYAPDGVTWKELHNYKNGKLDGKYQTWDKFGFTKLKGSYQNGVFIPLKKNK